MNSLSFGTIGLKAVESGIISYKQIESARQAINRKLNRKGKIWIRIFNKKKEEGKYCLLWIGCIWKNNDYQPIEAKESRCLLEEGGMENLRNRGVFFFTLQRGQEMTL